MIGKRSRVFGYPKSLIEIDITNIMTSLTIVILFGFIAFLILELFSTLLRIDDFAFSKILKSATATKFAAMSLLMAMSTISLLPIIWLLSDGSRYFFFSNIAEIRPIATLALLALVMAFANVRFSPLFENAHLHTGEKDKIDDTIQSGQQRSIKKPRITYSPVLVILSIVYFIQLPITIGGIGASTRTTFFHLNTDLDFILARRYGDNFVFVKRDSATGELGDEYYVMEIPSGSGLKLVKIRKGRKF